MSLFHENMCNNETSNNASNCLKLGNSTGKHSKEINQISVTLNKLRHSKNFPGFKNTKVSLATLPVTTGDCERFRERLISGIFATVKRFS